MFYGCSKLSNIKPLMNWNISNGNDFSSMFNCCSSLLSTGPIKKWNLPKDKLYNIK